MKNRVYAALIMCITTGSAFSQEISLSLKDAINIASDNSLQSFQNKSTYLTNYWSYRNYKAARLPSMSLNLTPASYYRDITKRYDPVENVDVYRTQQSFNASGSLDIVQNFDPLGGTFFINSTLGYQYNRGETVYESWSATPFRVGYRQDNLGYNRFKWDRRIEPLKYEKAKKDYVVQKERISQDATSRFFELAMAQAEYDLAKKRVGQADTLYQIGQRRFKLATITQDDLLTLELEAENAFITLDQNMVKLKSAMSALASFLNYDRDQSIRVEIPAYYAIEEIPLDEALSHAIANNPDYIGMQLKRLEAEKELSKTKQKRYLDASVDLSIGFNQAANTISNAYKNLLQQDIVGVRLSIPLVDWGIRKGDYQIAKNNLEVAKLTIQQEQITLEDNLMNLVADFNISQRTIKRSIRALDLADLAYSQTRQRFMNGQATTDQLTLAEQRQEDAQSNYISSLRSYWESYYKVRQITLYDFEMNMPITNTVEY